MSDLVYRAENKYIFDLNLQFFAKDGPGGEKTEEPTSKKLSDARKEGQVCKSKEVTTAISLVALFLILKIYTPYMGENFIGDFSEIYHRIPDYATGVNFNSLAVMAFFRQAMFRSLILVLPFFAAGVVVSFVVDLVQVKWKVTTKPLKPKLDKFNPVNGFKRIFSKDSLIELLKSIIKIAAIAIIAYVTLRGRLNEVFLLYNLSLNSAISEIGDVVIDVGFRISLFFCIIGAGDYAYQKWKFHDEMKMTKQEVKDEMKNTEGDPQIKGKQRQRMQEASRRRMIQEVPKADVVITNPTHFAVALKYDKETSSAPRVVAKGTDLIAQRIKDIARENDVDIVENVKLARTLYYTVDIGHEISPDLYQVVADILVAVYQRKGNLQNH